MTLSSSKMRMLMVEKLSFDDQAKAKLLCFPLALKVGLLQVPHIVNISGLEKREMVTYIRKFLDGQSRELLQSVTAEIKNNAEIAEREARRDVPFYDSEFLHGVYAVSRVLLAQAQENRDFLEKGVYPTITEEAYISVIKQRFEKGDVKETPLRARFLRERTRLLAEQPILGKLLHVVIEGLEIDNSRQADFYGGAAFAYQLFSNAIPHKTE